MGHTHHMPDTSPAMAREVPEVLSEFLEFFWKHKELSQFDKFIYKHLNKKKIMFGAKISVMFPFTGWNKTMSSLITATRSSTAHDTNKRNMNHIIGMKSLS